MCKTPWRGILPAVPYRLYLSPDHSLVGPPATRPFSNRPPRRLLAPAAPTNAAEGCAQPETHWAESGQWTRRPAPSPAAMCCWAGLLAAWCVPAALEASPPRPAQHQGPCPQLRAPAASQALNCPPPRSLQAGGRRSRGARQQPQAQPARQVRRRGGASLGGAHARSPAGRPGAQVGPPLNACRSPL